jgi:hypothetical protein
MRTDKIIGSYQMVAILEVSLVMYGKSLPQNVRVSFTVTFRTLEARMLRLERFETLGRLFGMRVGHENVELMVIPLDPLQQTTLVLIDVVDLHDPNLQDLSLY